MSKWLEDLLLNIEIWLYRRLRKLLQHGGEDFAVSLDTLHAHLADKESKVAAVYNDLEERLVNVAEGVPVRPLPAEVEGLPSVRDLNHLRASVGLLATRKIDTGSLQDGVPDGVSLVRLLCDSSLASQVTELVDTNHDWVMDKSFPQLYPLSRMVIGAASASNIRIINYADLQYLKMLATTIAYSSKIESYSNNGIVNNVGCTVMEFPNLQKVSVGEYGSFIGNANNLISLTLPEFQRWEGTWSGGVVYNCANLEELILPKLEYVGGGGGSRESFALDCPKLRKCISGYGAFIGSYGSVFARCVNLIHLEFLNEVDANQKLRGWSPTNALRTDTTASDYIDLREDKDEQGEFINATNLEQFLANFRKYIILRLASRKSTTALTLTLSAAVYQAIYGLDSSNNTDNNSWARTHTLADLGLTADDLTEAEQAAGITINTIYATWLDTYRAAINWNIGH